MADGYGQAGFAARGSTSSEVVAALGQQVVCYRQLAKLAARQHEFVRLEQTEELLALLQDRQAVLTQISSLEEVVAVARKDWAAFTAALTDEDRATAERMLAETRRLLAEITAGDERDALTLQQRKHSIGSEIKATTAAKSVNRMYAASAYGRQRTSSLDARS